MPLCTASYAQLRVAPISTARNRYQFCPKTPCTTLRRVDRNSGFRQVAVGETRPPAAAACRLHWRTPRPSHPVPATRRDTQRLSSHSGLIRSDPIVGQYGRLAGRDFDATPRTSLLAPQSRPFLAHQVWGARLRWAVRADEEPTATKGGDPSGTYKRWFGRVSGRDGWWRGSLLVNASYWPRCH